MAKYIDVEPIIKGGWQLQRYNSGDGYVNQEHASLKDISSADVRPVVFCRDCKHSHMTYDGKCKYCDFWQEDGGGALYLPKDFFCAAGEREGFG